MDKAGSGGRVRGVHWDETSARAMLSALDASGQTTVQFARENGFHPSKVNWWRKELAKRSVRGSRPVTLLPVEVRGPADAATIEFEMVLPCGVVVRVRSGCDEKALVRLIRAASEATRC